MSEAKKTTPKEFQTGYTLVGNGDLRREELALCLQFCPRLIGVDGGAVAAQKMGYSPDMLIGDLDSCPAETQAMFPPSAVCHIREQESTDFEKALAWVLEQRHLAAAPPSPILCAGFTGARIDHLLAGMNALSRFSHAPIIVVGERDVIFLAPCALKLRLAIGMRLSLFPLAPVRGKSRGLEWSIEGIRFAPNGRVGTSNKVIESDVALEFDAPEMLVILPRTALDEELIATVCDAPRTYGGA